MAHGGSALMLMSTFKCWLTSSLYGTVSWIGKGSPMSMALHDILDGFGFDFIQISQTCISCATGQIMCQHPKCLSVDKDNPHFLLHLNNVPYK